MTFYVKRPKDAEVEGPFTIEQINQILRQKRFTFKSLAIADTGQGWQTAQSTPLKQWISYYRYSWLRTRPRRGTKKIEIKGLFGFSMQLIRMEPET